MIPVPLLFLCQIVIITEYLVRLDTTDNDMINEIWNIEARSSCHAKAHALKARISPFGFSLRNQAALAIKQRFMGML